MKIRYEARVPSKFKTFIGITGVIAFFITFSIVWVFSEGEVLYPLLWGAITSLGSMLYSIYVVRYVIAPRIEGFRITDTRVYFPRRTAEALGKKFCFIREIKSISFTGNYLMIELMDRTIAPILSFEREKIEKILNDLVPHKNK